MDFKSFARRHVQSSIRTGIRFAARQLSDPKNSDLLSDLLGQKSDPPKQEQPPAPERKPAPTSGRKSGDYTGPIKPLYSPDLDGDADPGEIVWGWVPYEEDHKKGKDRPVLIIGRDNKWLLGLMLTSKDNIPGDVGEVRESEHGSRYINVGTGDWDKQKRPSEIRLDRVIRIDARDVRREGAIMPMSMFSRVVDAVQ